MPQRQQLGRIAKLLNADEANTRVSPGLMRALHPWAESGFEDTAELFRLLYRRVGDWSVERDLDERLRRLAADVGLTDEELVGLLNRGQAGHIEEAVAAYSRLWTLRVVKLVLLMCQRYWAWGASDLFRLRITSAQGYLRLEAESLALIVLFLKDDALAERWSRLQSREAGRQFFRDTQPQVRNVLKAFDLNNTYDIASTGAQHVRMAGLVRGLISKDDRLGLPDQDFDPEDPYSFHLAVAHFHRIQARILPALGSALPGTDEVWLAHEQAFVNRAAEVWKTLASRYAHEISEQGDNDETS